MMTLTGYRDSFITNFLDGVEGGKCNSVITSFLSMKAVTTILR